MMFTLPLIPFEKKWRTLSFGALIFILCYFSAALFGKDRAVLVGFNYLDNQIPFLNWTIWFYVSQYLLLPVSFYFIRKQENYSAMFYAMLMAVILSSLVFMLYPTKISRPEKLDTSLFDQIRWILYQLDSPTNCFPSLHVALACLSSIYISREHKIIGAFSWVWSLLIILSTMTLKQHYVIDVAGGGLMAILTYKTVDLLLEDNEINLTLI